MGDNATWKTQALQALKGNWQTALLVMFVAMVPSLAASVLRELMTADASSAFFNAVYAADMDKLTSSAWLGSLVPLNTLLLLGGVTVAARLLGAGLQVGVWHYDAELLRGHPGRWQDAFSRMRIVGKAVLVELIIIGKVLLWGLPGVAVVYGGLALTLRNAVDSYAAVQIALVVVWFGSLLCVVPMVAAVLRHSMASRILAERPETGALASIRESKALMKRRTGRYFMLLFSFIGWFFLILVLESFLASVFGGVISTVVYLFLTLAVNVYAGVTEMAFFQTYDKGQIQRVEPESGVPVTEAEAVIEAAEPEVPEPTENKAEDA